MRRIAWLAAVLSLSAYAGTPVQLTPAQQQAILDSGTSFGQGTLAVGAGTVNGTGGAAGVPSYNTTPSAQAPGEISLAGPAAAKEAGCNGYTAPAGAGQTPNQQDCNAVDFLAKHPNPASAYPINPATDPTMQAGAAVLKSARNGSAFQPGGVAAGGVGTSGSASAGTTTQTACQTITTTTPAVTTTAQCYVAATEISQTCGDTLSVSVGLGLCSPGSALGKVVVNDCPSCLDPYFVMVITCGSDGASYNVHLYRSTDGTTSAVALYVSYGYPASAADMGTFHVAVAPGFSVANYFVGTVGYGCSMNIYYSITCSNLLCVPTETITGSSCNGGNTNTSGSPLALPLMPVETWTDTCAALQAKTQ
jgi:hypothetical protein